MVAGASQIAKIHKIKTHFIFSPLSRQHALNARNSIKLEYIDEFELDCIVPHYKISFICTFARSFGRSFRLLNVRWMQMSNIQSHTYAPAYSGTTMTGWWEMLFIFCVWECAWVCAVHSYIIHIKRKGVNCLCGIAMFVFAHGISFLLLWSEVFFSYVRLFARSLCVIGATNIKQFQLSHRKIYFKLDEIEWLSEQNE